MAITYYWRRSAKGVLYLKGTPAHNDPRNPKRVIPGRKSYPVQFANHRYTTDDPWEVVAIEATPAYRNSKIVRDGGKVPAIPLNQLATDWSAVTRALERMPMMPDEEPGWGAFVWPQRVETA